MAFSFTDQANGVGIPFNYTRGNPIPLDSWSLFMSYQDAETYAKQNPVSYPGQIITVLQGGESKVYVIVQGSEYADGDEIPEGKKIGDEITSTRTLVELGQQSSSGAEIFWLNEGGNPING